MIALGKIMHRLDKHAGVLRIDLGGTAVSQVEDRARAMALGLQKSRNLLADALR